jgi:hypothetical protein
MTEQTEKRELQYPGVNETREKAIVFFDDNISYEQRKWMFVRRLLYEQKAVISVEQLIFNLNKNENYFIDGGFEVYYLIFENPDNIENYSTRFPNTLKLAMTIGELHEPIQIITDADGIENFKIYKVTDLSFVSQIRFDT